MKTKKEIHPVINNLLKIMKLNNIKQATMAEYAGVEASQISKILSGSVQLSLWQLSKIANKIDMRIIDIFTYPDVYEKINKEQKTTKILVELEVNEKEFVELCLKNKIKILFGNT
jgi:transcriptional regulator with XRE-family HTH domain